MTGTSSAPSPTRMPVLFVGHGSPMNAIEDNEWSRGFRSLAPLLHGSKAILSISAHWFVRGVFLTSNPYPETIHDFAGFPRELFEMEYPAPGDPDLAKRIVRLIGQERASLRNDWGLDHGTWSVLHHMRPEADCPVVQLSIDSRMPPEDHLALGRMLAPLRDEGVLLMASGNIVHNLPYAMASYANGDLSTPPWATEFDADVARALDQNDGNLLVRMIETHDGRRSHPTLDHFLPLLYAVGAAEATDVVRFPITGFDLGSLSMRAVVFG